MKQKQQDLLQEQNAFDILLIIINKFITIDYWKSEKHFTEMKQSIVEAYDTLDKQCEHFTISENHLGYFNNVQFKNVSGNT